MENNQWIINAIVQLLIFTLIPFIWWLINKNKNSDFLTWLGLKKPIVANKNRLIAVLLFNIFLMVLSFVFIQYFMEGADLATSNFSGKGISVIIPVLVYAFIQTGLAEEIFFRGFLTKRLINKFGFTVGNIIQGLLFGLLHGVMFYSTMGFFLTVLIVIITGLSGWVMGLMNEKYADGSIIVSWLVHSCSNVIASLFAMFNFI